MKNSNEKISREKNKEKNFISSVIYIHNAQDRIEQFLKTVADVMESNFEHSEIICVNDFSDDDSVKIIKNIAEEINGTTITILNMSYFHGLEVSMNAGMDLAIGDFVLEFDTTSLDFDKSEIMKIEREALKGYEIVSASPDRKQRLSSKVFYSIFNSFTGMSNRISTESFRILSRRVINRISSMNTATPYRKAVYANCGLKTLNIKYKVTDRQKNKQDKMENKYRMDLAVDTMILFTEFGYRFSISMTIIMMCIAVFVAAYSAVIYIFSTPVAGWTTTIFFMSFAFFGLFGILTIIIKYLQILVNLVFKRKHYSFESIEKI